MLGNIDYKDYRKQNDIHGTALYPAVMVAPVQNRILELLIQNDEINSVFDSFHGSGTSLYEAMKISDNIELYGCDINPLANLITKVKLQGVEKNIESDINKIINLIENNDGTSIHTFNNISKWFRSDIIISLSKIRNSIIEIENENNRLYFWYIFSDVVRKYSNTRSSTYKLHTKKQDLIDNLEDNSINTFVKAIKENYKLFTNKSEHFKLAKIDVLKYLPGLKDRLFDVCITSPPYGDNATTVPYGQFSMLPLYWIDSKDLELEGWELENYSIIDNKSLGGKNKIVHFDNYELELLHPYTSNISSRKLGKVYSFFYDYFEYLNQLTRVTNKYIVMTLGNRTVDGIIIDLTSITKSYLEANNFMNIEIASREIPNKRIPRKTSKVGNKSVSSINEEYVIVHKRK